MSFIAIGLFWLLALWAFFSRGPALLYLYFGSLAFGSTAVIPTELVGGLSIVPFWVVAAMLVARTLLVRSGPDFFLSSALSSKRLGLLAGYMLVATLVTVFMPRIFRGEIMVVQMRGIREGLLPLAPTAANLSQLVYVLVSGLTIFAFARILRSRSDRQHALNALCFGALFMVLTGFADYLSLYVTPLKGLLDSLRTASYAMAVNVEIFGGKRVVGMMPEASTFGLTTLWFLAALIFFRRVIADSTVRNVYAPLLIGCLTLLVYLSTSSGALVGLAILICAIGADLLLRSFSRGRAGQPYRQAVLGEVTVVLALISAVGLLLLLVPQVLEPVYALIDRMVLSKTESESFAERGQWRAQALETLFASYGLGIGVGSTRASSTIVAIFSSTGILGGLLFFGFVLQTLTSRTRHLPWEAQAMMSAYRFAFIAPFAVSSMVGGVQLGGVMIFGLGLAVALVTSREARHARVMADEFRRSPLLLQSHGIPLLPAPQPRSI